MGDNEKERIFKRIDLIIKEIDSAKVEPKFSEEINARNQRDPCRIQDDNDVLRRFARLIAFSQNAPSDKVSDMLNKGIFEDVFCNFEVEKVARMDSTIIKNHYWDEIKIIRFPKKITSIIGCARCLVSIKEKHGSFMALLVKSNIPVFLRSEVDIEKFWQGFNRLKEELEKENMPFFRRATSLLHFLLHIGYDCIKPDTVVMRVAKKLGIVNSERGSKNLLFMVRFIQVYSVERKIRPSIVDFYLLVYGEQRWAKGFVVPSTLRKSSLAPGLYACSERHPRQRK